MADWQYPTVEKFSSTFVNRPVTKVNWNDAKAYAHWLVKGFQQRLNGSLLVDVWVRVKHNLVGVII